MKLVGGLVRGRRYLPLVSLAAAGLLAATLAPALAGGASVPGGLPVPLPGPDRTAPTASPPAAWSASTAPGSPAWPADFPDPFVLPAGGLYYAYGTEAGATKVQTIVSPDLVHWAWVGDSLADLPAWSSPGHVWAPSVLATPAGYVMFYATRERATGRQCISRAVSALPAGPYVDTSAAPVVCQRDRGGSIDPSPFVDVDGSTWLVWKSEGTLAGEPTRVWSARMSPDGARLAGPANQLITTTQGWEGPIVEGPSMVRQGGRYYLFYSANRWETAAYAIGYAVCADVRGPCVKPSAGPLISTRAPEAGPGSPSLFSTPDGLRLAYHAWTAPRVGYPGGARSLHVASVDFIGGAPSVRE